MFIDYFVNFYVRLQLSYSMPVTEGVFILCALVLTNRFECRPRYFLRIFVHLLLFWTALILIKSVANYFGLGLMTYIPAVAALLYALLFGNRPFGYRMFDIVYYLVVHVFSTSFAKSCGALICTAAGAAYTEWMASLSLTVGRIVLFVGFTALAKLLSMEKAGRIAGYYYVFAAFILVVAYVAQLIVDNIKDFTNGLINPTETEYAPCVFFVGLLLYILAALSYYSCWYQTSRRRAGETLEEEMGYIKEKFEAERDMRDLSRDNLEEMRKIRHDIKNQFAYMRIILEQNKYDELREYFDNLSDRVAVPLSFSDCENRVVRDVLNLEMGKLPKGVTIDYKVAVGAELAVGDIDLTALLINLLDNAIEACERDRVTGAIELRMRETDGYLFVSVYNPVSDEAKARKVFAGKTSKSGADHGYGTKIVAAVVEKYRGVINYTVEKGRFGAEAMLALNK